MKKLKFLEIASAFAPVHGGTERVVEGLSAELALRGHEVTVLTTNLLAPHSKLGEEKIVFSKNGEKASFKLVRVPNRLFLAGYGYAPGVVGWLAGHWREFDVAHVHGYNRHATESALLFLHGKLPTVFTAHGFYHTRKMRLLKKLHEKFVGSKAARAAGACTAITEDDIASFEKMGVEKQRIFLIPNGLDVDKFAKKPVGRNVFAKFKPFALFVGRIHSSKGLQFLAAAVKDLPCRLVIVGKDAGFEGSLREIVSALKMREKVVFWGEASEKELVQAYRACEMLILPSEWEAFGVVLVEAMAAGKPVVGSDGGSIPLLVRNGRNGFVVPYGDAAKLREKIRVLLEDKDLARRMGAEGRKFAQQFSWKSVAAKTEELYFKLASRKLPA